MPTVLLYVEIVVDAVVWEMLTVYVPTPPVPVPSAVMVVPATTPEPVTTSFTDTAPLVTALMVMVVPEIEAVPTNLFLKPVMTVPLVTPVPEMASPRFSFPTDTAVTLSWLDCVVSVEELIC